MRDWTADELRAQVDAFGWDHVRRVRELLRTAHRNGHGHALDLSLTFAVASRETGIRNILGDLGHGRGTWQSDDRWETRALARVPGCQPGHFKPCGHHHSALKAGHVPGLRNGFLLFLRAWDEHYGFGVTFGRLHGIPHPHDRIAFALASYNGGPGNALISLRDGDVDLRTANRDYSADTLARRRVLHRYFVAEL
jgi:hypothetical protein